MMLPSVNHPTPLLRVSPNRETDFSNLQKKLKGFFVSAHPVLPILYRMKFMKAICFLNFFIFLMIKTIILG